MDGSEIGVLTGPLAAVQGYRGRQPRRGPFGEISGPVLATG
jgi:hypothetical protein